jgi:hypothetical protein
MRARKAIAECVRAYLEGRKRLAVVDWKRQRLQQQFGQLNRENRPLGRRDRKRLWRSSWPARTQAGGTSRTHFMQAVNEELTKFERCEREFRKKDRDERAKGLQMPIETTTPKIGA